MKNNFEVNYSHDFFIDLNNITSHIKYTLGNGIAAENLVDKIEKRIKIRSYNPTGYEQYKTKAGNVYYRIYINNYIIFYTLKDNIMTIRRIYYAKSNLKNLIK